MLRRLQRIALLSSAVLALLASTAHGRAGFPEIESDLETLRAAFNADRGKVRAVLLVAPT